MIAPCSCPQRRVYLPPAAASIWFSAAGYSTPKKAPPLGMKRRDGLAEAARLHDRGDSADLAAPRPEPPQEMAAGRRVAHGDAALYVEGLGLEAVSDTKLDRMIRSAAEERELLGAPLFARLAREDREARFREEDGVVGVVDLARRRPVRVHDVDREIRVELDRGKRARASPPRLSRQKLDALGSKRASLELDRAADDAVLDGERGDLARASRRRGERDEQQRGRGGRDD